MTKNKNNFLKKQPFVSPVKARKQEQFRKKGEYDAYRFFQQHSSAICRGQRGGVAEKFVQLSTVAPAVKLGDSEYALALYSMQACFGIDISLVSVNPRSYVQATVSSSFSLLDPKFFFIALLLLNLPLGAAEVEKTKKQSYVDDVTDLIPSRNPHALAQDQSQLFTTKQQLPAQTTFAQGGSISSADAFKSKRNPSVTELFDAKQEAHFFDLFWYEYRPFLYKDVQRILKYAIKQLPVVVANKSPMLPDAYANKSMFDVFKDDIKNFMVQRAHAVLVEIYPQDGIIPILKAYIDAFCHNSSARYPKFGNQILRIAQQDKALIEKEVILPKIVADLHAVTQTKKTDKIDQTLKLTWQNSLVGMAVGSPLIVGLVVGLKRCFKKTVLPRKQELKSKLEKFVGYPSTIFGRERDIINLLQTGKDVLLDEARGLLGKITYEQDCPPELLEIQQALDLFAKEHETLRNHKFLEYRRQIKQYLEQINKGQTCSQHQLKAINSFIEECRLKYDVYAREIVVVAKNYLHLKSELVKRLEPLRMTIKQIEQNVAFFTTFDAKIKHKVEGVDLNDYFLALLQSKQRYNEMCQKISKLKAFIESQLQIGFSVPAQYPQKLNFTQIIQYNKTCEPLIADLRGLSESWDSALQERDRILDEIKKEHDDRMQRCQELIGFFKRLKERDIDVEFALQDMPKEAEVHGCFLATTELKEAYLQTISKVYVLRKRWEEEKEKTYARFVALTSQEDQKGLLGIIDKDFKIYQQYVDGLEELRKELKNAREAVTIALRDMSGDHKCKFEENKERCVAEYKKIYEQLKIRLSALQEKLRDYRRDADKLKGQRDDAETQELELYFKKIEREISLESFYSPGDFQDRIPVEYMEKNITELKAYLAKFSSPLTELYPDILVRIMPKEKPSVPAPAQSEILGQSEGSVCARQQEYLHIGTFSLFQMQPEDIFSYGKSVCGANSHGR